MAPVEASDRRERHERIVVPTGAQFTVKVEQDGRRDVYACSRYSVSVLPAGSGAKLTMLEHGATEEKVLELKAGSSVFVSNAHGATVDVVRTPRA